MNKNTTCSERSGTMQKGYVLDRIEAGKTISSWVEGEPEKDFWAGGLNLSRRQVFQIIAFRCENCGFLKFYTGLDISSDK